MTQFIPKIHNNPRLEVALSFSHSSANLIKNRRPLFNVFIFQISYETLIFKNE